MIYLVGALIVICVILVVFLWPSCKATKAYDEEHDITSQ